jgi:hypothetical protein
VAQNLSVALILLPDVLALIFYFPYDSECTKGLRIHLYKVQSLRRSTGSSLIRDCLTDATALISLVEVQHTYNASNYDLRLNISYYVLLLCLSKFYPIKNALIHSAQADMATLERPYTMVRSKPMQDTILATGGDHQG